MDTVTRSRTTTTAGPWSSAASHRPGFLRTSRGKARGVGGWVLQETVEHSDMPPRRCVAVRATVIRR